MRRKAEASREATYHENDIVGLSIEKWAQLRDEIATGNRSRKRQHRFIAPKPDGHVGLDRPTSGRDHRDFTRRVREIEIDEFFLLGNAAEDGQLRPLEPCVTLQNANCVRDGLGARCPLVPQIIKTAKQAPRNRETDGKVRTG